MTTETMTTETMTSETAKTDNQTPEKPIDPVDGRQGVTGHNVRYVLGGSLALALIVLAVALGVFA